MPARKTVKKELGEDVGAGSSEVAAPADQPVAVDLLDSEVAAPADPPVAPAPADPPVAAAPADPHVAKGSKAATRHKHLYEMLKGVKDKIQKKREDKKKELEEKIRLEYFQAARAQIEEDLKKGKKASAAKLPKCACANGKEGWHKEECPYHPRHLRNAKIIQDEHRANASKRLQRGGFKKKDTV